MEVISSDHDDVLLQTEYFDWSRTFDISRSTQLSVCITPKRENLSFDGENDRMSLSTTSICYNLKIKK